MKKTTVVLLIVALAISLGWAVKNKLNEEETNILKNYARARHLLVVDHEVVCAPGPPWIAVRIDTREFEGCRDGKKMANAPLKVFGGRVYLPTKQ